MGYYKSLGSIGDEAVYYLENAPTTQNFNTYTNIGKDGDATSLDNVLKSISFIKECNSLRETENVSTLKVSLTLMAKAQLNANWASNVVAHASNQGVHGVMGNGENLAWAFNGNAYTSSSPFRGWYDEEKEYYDFINDYKAKNPNATNDEIIQAAKEANVYMSSTGHYENIIGSYFVTTGYAMATISNTLSPLRGLASCQEFGGSSYEAASDVMTVDEFEKSLTNYINNVNIVKTQYQTYKDAVTTAQANANNKSAAVTAALSTLNAKKATLSDLQTAINNAKTVEKEASDQATTAKNNVTAAKNAVTAADTKVSTKKQELETANTALESAKSNLTTKESAQTSAETALQTAQNKKTEADALVTEKTNQLNNWSTDKAKAQQALKDAQSVQTKAEEKVQSAKDALTAAESELLDAKAVRDSKQEDVNKANNALESAQSTLDEKTKAYNDAVTIVDNYKATQKEITEAEKAVEEAGNKVDSLKAEKTSIQKNIDSKKAEIETLNEELNAKNTEANTIKNMQSVLADVLENGTATDFSSITNEKVHAKLESLAQEVDKLHSIQKELNAAIDNYTEKYNAYLDAKADLSKAQTKYEDAMKALNNYLTNQKTNKNSASTSTTSSNKTTVASTSKTATAKASTTGVNTGVETNMVNSVAMLGLASISLLSTKRKKSLIRNS